MVLPIPLDLPMVHRVEATAASTLGTQPALYRSNHPKFRALKFIFPPFLFEHFFDIRI